MYIGIFPLYTNWVIRLKIVQRDFFFFFPGMWIVILNDFFFSVYVSLFLEATFMRKEVKLECCI